jgi:hypothetical protein
MPCVVLDCSKAHNTLEQPAGLLDCAHAARHMATTYAGNIHAACTGCVDIRESAMITKCGALLDTKYKTSVSILPTLAWIRVLQKQPLLCGGSASCLHEWAVVERPPVC